MAIIFDKTRIISGYLVRTKIQTVPPNPNRPDGFKVNFVVVHRETGERILLVDNHAPIGYHIHPDPKEPKKRVKLEVSSPFEALEIFEQKVSEICHE